MTTLTLDVLQAGDFKRGNMATVRFSWTWAALIASSLFALSCSTPDSPTDLDPEGDPMVREVFLTAEVCPPPPMTAPPPTTCRDFVTGSGFQGQALTLAYGTHPQAVADGTKHKVVTGPSTPDPEGYANGAVVAGNKIRVIMDELLIGNYLEEIACNTLVDADQYQVVPVGTTPDDIAACSQAPDVLDETCKGEHAVCLCEIPGGCNAGARVVPPGKPVGILDEDHDGTSDAHQFITGSVGLKCGTNDAIDVPMSVEASYWQPSGNQQVPAIGGIGQLGPAIELAPAHGLPSGTTCHLYFNDNVTDKGGNNVCAPQWGADGAPDDTAWPPEVPCDPGDTSAVEFGVAPMRTTGGLPLPPPFNESQTVPRTQLTVSFNSELDLASFEDATLSPPSGTFTVSQDMDKKKVILTPSQQLAAQTDYTLTIPQPRDYFGQPLPGAPLVINFHTGN